MNLPAQFDAAIPLLVVGLITALLVPGAEHLVKFRLQAYLNEKIDAAVYAVDLYAMATLTPLIPIIGLAFLPSASTNWQAIFGLYVVATFVNLLALLRVLTYEDVHKYVDEWRFGLWSYPAILSLGAMVIVSALAALLSSPTRH